MRTVKVIYDSGNSIERFQSDGKTFGDIKNELFQKVPDAKTSRIIVGENKMSLESNDAVLPNNDIVLFIVPKEKIKSGGIPIFTVEFAEYVQNKLDEGVHIENIAQQLDITYEVVIELLDKMSSTDFWKEHALNQKSLNHYTNVPKVSEEDKNSFREIEKSLKTSKVENDDYIDEEEYNDDYDY